jgi:hypothetical protein
MLEDYIKPRFEVFDKPYLQVILGAVCIFLSVIVTMPLFLSNLLPGLALTLIAVGLVERDGLLISLGMAFGIICSILIIFIWFNIFNIFIKFG